MKKLISISVFILMMLSSLVMFSQKDSISLQREARKLVRDGNKTDNPVKTIANIVANAQKSEFETKQFSDYKDQFQWFLGIGILFLILDIFLFEKKTKWLRKVDLFNEEESKKN